MHALMEAPPRGRRYVPPGRLVRLAPERFLSFSGKTAEFDTGSIGGWLMSAGNLAAPGIILDSANDRILIGDASAPMVGVGGYWGHDGGAGENYDFRVGDPNGEYIHFDASLGLFDVNVENFTADNPVFEGSVSVQAGEGEERVRLTAVDGHGVVTLFNADEDAIGRLSTTSTDFGILSSGTLSIGALGNIEIAGGGVTGIELGELVGNPQIGFLGATPVVRQSVTGQIGSTTWAQNLATALDNLGLITDDST